MTYLRLTVHWLQAIRILLNDFIHIQGDSICPEPMNSLNKIENRISLNVNKGSSECLDDQGITQKI